MITHCPLRATSFVWRTASGSSALTVVCKVTYEICPDISPLAEDQDEIHMEDAHWEDARQHSLTAPCDLVPYKPRADVLVTGHAYAPRGQPVRALFARIVVSDLNKTIAVYGDRGVLQGGELSAPAELERIPLCWERAAGGPGTSNPVGVVAYSHGVQEEAAWAPNFQPPGIYVASALDPIPPTCLGPLSPDWPDRLHRLGRAAASWDHRAWYARPLPKEVDAAYFNSAPADQQVAYLAPAERIVLENLHPEHTRVVTKLDGVVPRATLRWPGQPDGSVDLRCDTLWIDADRGVCCVTWRGTVSLEAALGAEIHITGDGRVVPPSVAGTTAWVDTADHPALSHPSATDSAVWVDESYLASVVRAAAPAPPAPPASEPEPDATETTFTLLAAGHAQGAPSLPFVPPIPGGPSPSVSGVEQQQRGVFSAEATTTLFAPLAPPTLDLPAGWGGPRPVVPLPPAVASTPVEAPFPSPPVALAPIAAPPPPPIVAPVPPPAMAPIGPAVEDNGESDALTERPPPFPGPPRGPIIPPHEPLPAPSTEALEIVPTEPRAPTIDVESFALACWAEILAEIDKALRPRAEVLRAHDLTDADWAAVDRRWKEALDREAAAGDYSLRLEHDTAYVATLERLRGRPITAPEYGRLLLSGERRRVAATLEAMDMPAAAHLPITRLWTMKLARDPRLSLEMLQAVAALPRGADERRFDHGMNAQGRQP